MGLTPEQIQALLAKPDKSRQGGRSKSGSKIDTSKRDYETWFKLAHHMLDETTNEHLTCDNPNCVDPRPHAPIVALVDEKYMCRFCFLAGWLTITDNTTIKS